MEGNRQFCQVGHDLIYARDLSLVEKMVCIYLLTFTQPAFPSMRKISEVVRKSESVIRTAIKGLEAKGYVRVDRGFKGFSNRYWVKKFGVGVRSHEPPAVPRDSLLNFLIENKPNQKEKM